MGRQLPARYDAGAGGPCIKSKQMIFKQKITNQLLTALSLWGLLMAFAACGTTRKQPVEEAAVNVAFNADSAYAFCAAQCAFGPRTMNSEAHVKCGEWIAAQFRRYGCGIELQRADLKGYDGTVLKGTNIIASMPQRGTDSTRVMICAHWDSRPWADNDPDTANWHKPVMAANDGASGVAVMLELARLLQHNDSLPVAVDFVCFDAEDWGVPSWSDAADDGNSWALGAQHWAKTYAASGSSRYRYAILLDMVGGLGARFYHEGFSLQHAKRLVDRLWSAASAAGYSSFFPMELGSYVTDDHIPVNEVARIPCVDIINYYPDCQQSSFGPTWHTVSDDMQHIDRNTLKAVGQTLLQLLFSE